MDALADRLLSLIKRISGKWVAALTIVFYPVLGLIVPLALDLPRSGLFVANVVGVYLAGLVSLGWLGGQLEAQRRRHLLEWTTELRHLNAEEFEWLVGETFRREGWMVTETGRQDAPDGNIDLQIERDGQRKMIQCKRWTAREVPVEEIRSFIGTLSVAGLTGRDGIFVTLSNFTQAAEEQAHKGHLELLDGKALRDRMDKIRRAEPCPICGRKMRLDHSPYGWWFRCVSPGCLGKKDLGGDPVRALEFLTEAP